LISFGVHEIFFWLFQRHHVSEFFSVHAQGHGVSVGYMILLSCITALVHVKGNCMVYNEFDIISESNDLLNASSSIFHSYSHAEEYGTWKRLENLVRT
jgi:hypothetical protein